MLLFLVSHVYEDALKIAGMAALSWTVTGEEIVSLSHALQRAAEMVKSVAVTRDGWALAMTLLRRILTAIEELKAAYTHGNIERHINEAEQAARELGDPDLIEYTRALREAREIVVKALNTTRRLVGEASYTLDYNCCVPGVNVEVASTLEKAAREAERYEHELLEAAGRLRRAENRLAMKAAYEGPFLTRRGGLSALA